MKQNKIIRMFEAFTGVGAYTMGLKKVFGKDNVEVVGSAELDKYAIHTYNAIHGTNYEPTDINDIDMKSLKDIDVLVGGWPCTSLSNAGKQKGMGNIIEHFYEIPTLENISNWYYKANNDGTYESFVEEYPSGLIYTLITKVYEMQDKPKYILLENVKGLLSKKFEKDLNLIKKLFDELGFNWDDVLLNSKYFGIPQSRERVYIMLTRKDLPQIKINHLKDKFTTVDKVLKDVLDFNEPTQTIEIKTILESDYGDGVKPEYSNYIYLPPTNPEKPLNNLMGRRLWKTDKFIGTISAGMAPKVYFKNHMSNYNGKTIELDFNKLNNQERDKINKVATLGELCDAENKIAFKEIPFNSDRTFTSVDGQASTLVAASVDGQASTLVAASPDFKNKIIYPENTLIHYRKLSVLECWRLMGFSDDDYYKVASLTYFTKSGKEKRLVSASQMAKQAGNSIVVNVLVEIFKELLND